MNDIDLPSLRRAELTARHIEVFAESWSKRTGFSLYERTPRPSNALFFICADVRAVFFPAGGKALYAGKGDVLLIPKGSLYHVRVEGGSGSAIETYTVNFNLFDADGAELCPAPCITALPCTENHRLEVRAARLCETVHRIEAEGQRNLLRINAEFFALLDALIDSTVERNDIYYPIRLGAEALRNEWNKNEKIETYAALCGLSNAYFYRCFRRWSGKSPVEYRNLIRLSNAETMLRYTDMKIGEISELVGFEDAFYFTRIFAAHYGLSPGEYRKTFGRNDLSS